MEEVDAHVNNLRGKEREEEGGGEEHRRGSSGEGSP